MGKVKYFVVCLIIAFLAFLNYSSASAQTTDDSYINTAKPESTVPWEYEDESGKTTFQTSSSAPVIADISKWQGNINWAKASKVLDLVIIRTQYGSSTVDYMHSTYEKNAKKYGVPFGVYSYVLASTPSEARKEARNFYKRASKSTKFYVLDVEEITSKKGTSMRKVIAAYVDELNKLTNKKIGLYVANHLYSKLNLKVSDFDFVWIPRYSKEKPNHRYDLWQYTSKGRVSGISGNVDLNRLAPGKSLSYFTGERYKKVASDDFYRKNPKYVIAKSNLRRFNSTAFTTYKNVVKKGQVVKVKKVVKAKNGAPRLQLTNGQYISANKKYVLKWNDSLKLSDYYTGNDALKTIVLKVNNTQYKSVDFKQSTRSTLLKKGVPMKVKAVVYTDGGTPRIKLSNGLYVTAKKSVVQKLKSESTVDQYYTNLGGINRVVVKADAHTYSSTAFKQSTRLSMIPQGTVVDVKSIVYSVGGVPRLKLKDGTYMTASFDYVQRIVSNLEDYYTTVPQSLIVTTATYTYNQVNLENASIDETLFPGTAIHVEKVVYTNEGYPVFQLAEGRYVTAEKFYFE